MATIQPAASGGTNNPSFATILRAMKSRIVTALATAPSLVRIVQPSQDRITEYLAQRGVLLRVRAPDPFAPSGAGRYGYMVQRQVDVFVVTENLSDPGGQDDAATLLHLDREEAVINCLLLNPPVGSGYDQAVGKTIKWVPGGDLITRNLKNDTGTLVSVLPFEITYPLRVNVLRD